jgi:hypothetical protein
MRPPSFDMGGLFRNRPCRETAHPTGRDSERGQKKEKRMAYVPFDPSYTPLRTPQYVAAELARRTAHQSRVNDIVTQGNAVMGGLVADCCSDPAYAGQGFYDDSNGAYGTPGSTASNPMAVLPAPGSYPLTPVDILNGGNGFPVRADGKPWPRPRLPRSERQRRIAAYPNLVPEVDTRSLVPPCPCLSSAPPVPIRVPVVASGPAASASSAPRAAPTPPSAMPAPAACPYPGCSTGNVCLDLVTGCVLNSQIDSGQQLACALANYGVFGNKGFFLGDVIHGCQPPKYLGTPLPNPPQADPSMMATITAAMARRGMSGLGQDSNPLSGIGGLLAVVGMFGIVVWANKKL